MTSDHYVYVKFTGSGYRAVCSTRGCLWTSPQYQIFKYMGYGQAGALRKAQTLAEQDARDHRDDERRKAQRALK